MLSAATRFCPSPIFVMEFIGTAALLLTIQVSRSLDADLAPLAIGGVLMVLVYAGGPISGGHYNPAVSLAVFLGLSSWKEMLLEYWVAQLVGGVAGALMGRCLVASGSATPAVHIEVGDGYSLIQALMAEFIFTFLLCLVVLLVATHSKVHGNYYFGVSIGTVVTVGAIAVGNISGGAFNPAVTFGLSCASPMNLFSFYVFEAIFIQFVGGIAASGCYYLVAPDQFESGGGEVVGEITSLL